MNKRFSGWITPSRNFYECPIYGHIFAIKKHQELKKIANEKLNEWENDIENAREACESLEKKGEHPEWHTYEMAEYYVEKAIISFLKERGCLRVGTRSQKYMHVEGKITAEMIEFCKSLAEERGLEYVYDGNV